MKDLTCAEISRILDSDLWRKLKPAEQMVMAAGDGKIDLMREIFIRNIHTISSIYSSTGWGVSPLISAAEKGQTEAVKFLLKYNCAIDFQSHHGKTALIRAVEEGHVEVVRLLTEAGADLEIKTDEGMTALDLAIQHRTNGIKPEDDDLVRSKKRYLEKGNESIIQLLTVAAERRQMRSGQPSEKWVLLNAQTLAHVGVYPDIQKKLTTVFNFASRERYIVSDNLITNASAVEPSKSFDDILPAMVEQALAQFTQLGRKADEGFVLHGNQRLDKPCKPPSL